MKKSFIGSPTNAVAVFPENILFLPIGAFSSILARKYEYVLEHFQYLIYVTVMVSTQAF